jgi:biotin carboxyl carrier protein
MKLNITVDGREYVVEVRAVDEAPLASAGSRVEGSPVVSPPARAPGAGAANRPMANGPAAAAPAKVTGGGSPAVRTPAPVPPPWHDLSVGPDGQRLSPVAGTVVDVRVKVGDAVRPEDVIAEVRLSTVFSPLERPMQGTVRALRAGVVADVLVKPGDAVKVGQPLATVRPAG